MKDTPWLSLEEARTVLEENGHGDMYKNANERSIISAGTWVKYWLDQGKKPIIVSMHDVNTSQHDYDTYYASCEQAVKRVYGSKYPHEDSEPDGDPAS